MVSDIDDQEGKTREQPQVYISKYNDVFVKLPDGTPIIIKKDGRVIRPRTRVRGAAAENPGLLRLPEGGPEE